MSENNGEIDLIRATERKRLHALVNGDIEIAQKLHADNFQLITPYGHSFSKEQYLGGIASGELNYLIWEPDSDIAVHLYGNAAVIRYKSKLQIIAGGNTLPLMHCWHTDSYEKHDGVWQVVLSQATEIK
jgi:hypothetical protein